MFRSRGRSLLLVLLLSLFGCDLLGCDTRRAPVDAGPIDSDSAAVDAFVPPTWEAPDLGALPGELSALAWPAAPSIGREVEARSASELAAALATPGTRVRVRAPIDARVIVTASDVELLVDPGVQMGSLLVDRGLARVWIRGGRWTALDIQTPADFLSGAPEYREEYLTTDVLFDGVEVDAPDSAFQIRGRRIAIVRSRAHAARYSVWNGDTGPFDSEDVIVAENRFDSDGAEATVRIVSTRRSVVVHNRLSNGSKHNYRVHGRSDLALGARNQLVTTGIMLGTLPEDAVGTVWVIDNVLYHSSPSLFLVDPMVETLVSTGNTIYSDAVGCWLCEAPRPGWVVEGNTILPYQPPPP